MHYEELLAFLHLLAHLYCFSVVCCVEGSHQKSRSAVQQASDSGNETPVEEAGQFWCDPAGLCRMEQLAHHVVVT